MWRVWSGPRSATHSFGYVLRTAVTFTLFAWLWSAVIALLLHLAIRRVEKVDVIGATLRTSAAAVWFAPATMLLSSLSAWSIPAALALVVNATRLLYSQWEIVYPREEPATMLVPREAGLVGIGELPIAVLPRHLGPAMAISLGLQLGLAADLLSHPFLAAALMTMSAAILTVFAISAGAWTNQRQASLPRSVFGLILTLLLATGLSVVGVTGGHGWGFGSGNGDGNGSLSDLFRKDRDGNTDRKPPSAPKAAGSGDADVAHKLPPLPKPSRDLGGSFPGVILWPEIQPVTLLLAPLPVSGSGYAAPAHPLTIPFGGEYWMFRWLVSNRPPSSSFYERGTPAHLSFSTTDRWPLQMEAHQKLEQPIDIGWCGRIGVEIANADRFPGTVSLELVLSNTRFGATATESLGLAPVLSTPDLKADPVVPAAETLKFTVPAAGALTQFNEFQVIFRRARVRADKSARVAILRFVLSPR